MSKGSKEPQESRDHSALELPVILNILTRNQLSYVFTSFVKELTDAGKLGIIKVIVVKKKNTLH